MVFASDGANRTFAFTELSSWFTSSTVACYHYHQFNIIVNLVRSTLAIYLTTRSERIITRMLVINTAIEIKINEKLELYKYGKFVHEFSYNDPNKYCK